MKDNNVKLRPIEMKDLDILHKWRNDESIFNQLGGGFLPTSKEEMSNWMPNFSKKDSNNFRFLIEYEDVEVGFISLTGINYINSNGTLGIYIGENQFQNKGIATISLKMMHQFALKHLNLSKIKLTVNNNNESALRLYKKSGYEQVGLLCRERYINGQWLDVIIMECFLGRMD